MGSTRSAGNISSLVSPPCVLPQEMAIKVTNTSKKQLLRLFNFLSTWVNSNFNLWLNPESNLLNSAAWANQSVCLSRVSKLKNKKWEMIISTPFQKLRNKEIITLQRLLIQRI